MAPETSVILDLSADPVALTRALCDIPSVSGDERAIADAVETALRGYPHLEVLRDGDAVVARTNLGPPDARGDRGPPGHRARSRTTCPRGSSARARWPSCGGAGRST